MTLLELLVQELPKRGGWPHKANKLKFTTTKRIIDDVDNEYFHFPNLDRLVLSERVKFVTRDQYESELAASKQEWDGVGLPPVGCVCEFTFGPYEPEELYDIGLETPEQGTVVNVVSHKVTGDGTNVAIIYWDKDGGGRAACIVGSCLKPLSTDADKRRDAAIESLMRIVCGPSQASATVNKIYDAIAAGKIPDVKLGD